MTRALRRGTVVCAAAAALFASLACFGPRGPLGLGREPAWKGAPPPLAVGPVVPASRVQRSRLANGLDVLVLADPRLPIVTLGVVARRGAGSVAPERAGLAAYTAELMRRGAGGRDALALARAIDDLGARLEVSAGWDSTRVEVSGLARDRDRLFGILADVVRRPRFDRREAARARAERIAALRRAQDDPATLASWHFARLLYPAHRYGLPLGGTPARVRRLDAAAARAFHRRVFVPGDCIVFAVGDVEPAATIARAREAFGDWPAAKVPPPGPPPLEPPGRRVVIVNRPDLTQARIVLGSSGIARADPERVPASLANAVLGGSGFLSRLMTVVRAERGLTYGVRSGFAMRRHAGPFAVSTFTRVPETGRVVRILLEEIERMRREPPDDAELGRAKHFLAGSFVLGLETSEAIAAALVGLDVYGLPDDSLDTYRARVRSVSTGVVARVARERLRPQQAAVVVVGPAAQLRPQLEGLGPIEEVTP